MIKDNGPEESSISAVQLANQAVRCQWCHKPGVYGRVCNCPQAVASRLQTSSHVAVNDPQTPPLLPNSSRRAECWNCGDLEHIERQCPHPKRDEASRKRFSPTNPQTSQAKRPAISCPFCSGPHIGRTCDHNPLRRNQNVTCNYCGNFGHGETVCRIKQNDLRSSNSGQVAASSSGNDEATRKPQSRN